LKESSSGDESTQVKQQAAQTGSWNSKLHFVWSIVLAQYAQDAAEDGSTSDFENFWKVAVDGKYCLLLVEIWSKLIIFRKPILFHCLSGTQVLGLFAFPKAISRTHHVQGSHTKHIQSQSSYLSYQPTPRS
jgi:hypothetical protein